MNDLFLYYKCVVRFIRPCLGTCTDASIYDEHVINKAREQIKKANLQTKKISRSLDKFRGSEISENKEVLELQGIIRQYMQVIGKMTDIPDNVEELLSKAQELKEEFDDMCIEGEARRGTVFMRDENGWPIISSHMNLGNLKENLKILTNNNDKSIFPTKTSVGETMALDVKVIEQFLRPSMDVIKDANGKPICYERPIRFKIRGDTVSSIALSEQLPEGTEIEFTLRVRKLSKVTKEALVMLFSLGVNNGIGQFRGSGNFGAYVFKIMDLPDYKDPAIPYGWNTAE